MGFDALRAETRGLRSEKLSVGIHHFEILERPFLCLKETFFVFAEVYVLIDNKSFYAVTKCLHQQLQHILPQTKVF